MLADSLAFAFLGTRVLANSYSHKFLRRYFRLGADTTTKSRKSSSKWRGAKRGIRAWPLTGRRQDWDKTGFLGQAQMSQNWH